MNTLHIVMVSYDFLPNIGGVSAYVYEVSKALIKRGHQVTILTQFISWSSKKKEDNIDGIRVIRVPIPPVKKISDYVYRQRMRNVIQDMECNENIDVIHWHTLNKDAQVMKPLMIKALEVYTNHLSWFRMLYNDGHHHHIYKLIREPDVIICPSNEILTMSEDLFHSATIKCLPNGVDDQVFYPDQNLRMKMRTEYGIKEDETVIISTSRMEPVKGIEILLDAIPKVLEQTEKVIFILVGDGSQQEKFQQKMWENTPYHENVLFTGRLSNQDTRSLLQASDVFVQSSLMEGSSIAIAEAMACGKPVVATAVGGNCEMVTNSTGILVPPHNSEALKEALLACLQNPKKYLKFGENGREVVEKKLNWSNLAIEIEQLYRSPKR
ncbi:glycosyltransferase family 4 protein [Carnobacterium maltaromaticum]|uniref:glycosyltransferase family 4 protein n=1 Tax=Carnobacterium maltaromaticum TaxID=2751 RepID=UPI00191B938D|nr:glycosyltransferase family 4 protein [Carnobacterium maltaromaticum]CAD5902913.1 Glycosyl transferase family 1 [Carnobacterium maltaromaticum]